MVHTALIAAGKVLPSTPKKVVRPTYALLSRKMQEKANLLEVLCHLNY